MNALAGDWIISSAIIMVAVIFLGACCIRLYYYNKCCKTETEFEFNKIKEQAKLYARKPYEIVQMIFEIVISNTCIVGMLCIYYWIEKKLLFLSEYMDLLLLLLSLLTIEGIKFLDSVLNQDLLEEEDIPNIRLLSSCSIIFIFFILKIFFKSSQYNDLLLCYTCLVLGRFIFFDSTYNQISESIKNLKKYIIPLTIAMILTCLIGGLGIFLEVISAENVLHGLFVLHVVMLISIFIAKKAFREYEEIKSIFE